MSLPSLQIRAAREGDLADLLELYRHFNSGDPDPEPEIAAEQFAAMCAQPSMTVFIGFADGVATSTATLVVIPNLTRRGAPYALIENVVTHAGHRKHGYAGAVIQHAIEKAWEAGCYKVMLLTGSKDPATHRFYESCGFQQNKTGYQIRRI